MKYELIPKVSFDLSYEDLGMEPPEYPIYERISPVTDPDISYLTGHTVTTTDWLDDSTLGQVFQITFTDILVRCDGSIAFENEDRLVGTALMTTLMGDTTTTMVFGINQKEDYVEVGRVTVDPSHYSIIDPRFGGEEHWPQIPELDSSDIPPYVDPDQPPTGTYYGPEDEDEKPPPENPHEEEPAPEPSKPAEALPEAPEGK